MDNTDIKIVPAGHPEFFVNMEFPFLNTDAIVTAGWNGGTSHSNPYVKGLPAHKGLYTWRRATWQVMFFDEAGNPLMSFDDFVAFPPSSETIGPGELLFGHKQGITLMWEVT
jgi:hypothetical protein